MSIADQTRFRLATEADGEFVLDCRVQIASDENFTDSTVGSKEEADQIKEATKKGEIFIAEIDDEQGGLSKRIGCFWIIISRACPWGLRYLPWDNDYVWINYIYIVKEFRSKGIGKKVYRFVDDFCRKKDIPEIILDVMEENPPSQRFHEKIGFKPLTNIFFKKISASSSESNSEENPVANKTRIRLANGEDEEFVVRCRAQLASDEGFSNDSGSKESADQIKEATKKGEIFIAEIDDEQGGVSKRIGFLWITFTRKCSFGVNYLPMDYEYVWISFVFIVKEFRSKGIGKKMYRFVEDLCRKKGVEQIELDVMENNIDSRKFHEKLGFESYVKLYIKQTKEEK